MEEIEPTVFQQNLQNQINLIKNVIKNPKTLYDKFKDLKCFHQSLVNMVDQYQKVAVERVNNEIYQLAEPIINTYLKKVSGDIKNHRPIYVTKIEKYHKFKEHLDVPSDDGYDELLQYVDLSITGKTAEEKKIIKKFIEKRNEINEEFDELMNQLRDYEQNLVNFRQKEFENVCMNVLPKMYLSHLSEMYLALKAKQNGTVNNDEVQIVVNNMPIRITRSDKQSIFLRNCLRTYLGLPQLTEYEKEMIASKIKKN